jgi:hypothetical protein
MDPDVITFAAVCATVVATIGSLVAIGVAARATLLRAKRRAEHPPLDDSRLRQLQESVDAIAVEVERISEAQRFTTKLLADRERAER